jgi:hypothetical protein
MLCKVTIVMPDGSRGRHIADYRSTRVAFRRAHRFFPCAARISVIRLTPTTQGARS